MKTFLNKASLRGNYFFLQSGLVLVVTADLVAFPRFKVAWVSANLSFVEVLSVPTAAFLIYLCLTVCIPSLTKIKRFRFPLTVTLPIVFVALIKLMTALWSSEFNVLVRLPHLAMIVQFWGQTRLLLGLGLFQVLAMSTVGLFSLASAAAKPQE